MRLETFFSFLQQKCFFPKMDNISLPNKNNGGGGKLRPPDWPQLRSPAGQETDSFFVDSLAFILILAREVQVC